MGLLEELTTSWPLSFFLLACGAGQDSVSQPGVCVHVQRECPASPLPWVTQHMAGPGSMAAGGPGCPSPSLQQEPSKTWGCGTGWGVNWELSGFCIYSLAM